jgi:hypothetical protein
MKTLLGIVLAVFVINVVLIGVGVATGSLIRLVFPSVDRGMSILIGLLSSVFSIYGIAKLLAFVEREEPRQENAAQPVAFEEEEEPRVNSFIQRISIVPAPSRPAKTAKRRR